MKIILIFIFCSFILLSCSENTTHKNKSTNNTKFNQALADELNRMAEIDQIAAYIPKGKYEKLTKKEWNAFKDSVYTAHQQKIEVLFNKYGFLGYDLVGKEGSDNFWVLVQHSDEFPAFQEKVLEDMKKQLDHKNANPLNYAYLLDRVNINTGKEQVYGTQFSYDKVGQAFPYNIADTTGIDKRRKSVGLGPMFERMNEMTESHFLMNEEYYYARGITEPQMHKK